MTSLKKLLGSLLLLLGMSILVIEVVQQAPYQKVVHLPQVSSQLLTVTGIHLYLFWVSLGLVMVLFVSWIVLLAWPRRQATYLFQQKLGELTINRQAVTNFVASAVAREPFIKNAKVKVEMRRKKIKITVKGQLTKNKDAATQGQRFIEQVRQDLVDCLGVSQQSKISVQLKGYQPQKKGAHRVK